MRDPNKASKALVQRLDVAMCAQPQEVVGCVVRPRRTVSREILESLALTQQ